MIKNYNKYLSGIGILLIGIGVFYYFLIYSPAKDKVKEEEIERKAKEEKIEYKVKWCKKDCVFFPTKESWGYNPLFSMYADLLEFHNIIPEKADQFFPTEEKCIDYCIDWQIWSDK